jgi:hypothetical protein
VISGFRREVAENCSLLGYYALSSGNFLPRFQDKLSDLTLRVQEPTLNLEDGTEMSRNVGKKLPLPTYLITQKRAVLKCKDDGEVGTVV